MILVCYICQELMSQWHVDALMNSELALTFDFKYLLDRDALEIIATFCQASEE